MSSVVKTIRDDFATHQGHHEATPLKTAVEKSVDELAAERRQQRQKIRDKLASETTAIWQHAQAASDVSAWENKRSQIAITHRETVAPLEAELAEVESQQIQNQTDEALIERRADLLNQIRTAKAESDRQLDGYQVELERLEARRIAAAKQVPTGKRVSEADLLRSGDPKLLAAHELAKHDADAAVRRLDLLRNPLLKTPPEDIEAATEQVEAAAIVRRQCYENAINE